MNKLVVAVAIVLSFLSTVSMASDSPDTHSLEINESTSSLFEDRRQEILSKVLYVPNASRKNMHLIMQRHCLASSDTPNATVKEDTLHYIRNNEYHHVCTTQKRDINVRCRRQQHPTEEDTVILSCSLFRIVDLTRE